VGKEFTMYVSRLLTTFLLCISLLYPRSVVIAQDVKSTSDKSVDFKKYKKYSWGSNYLLTRQPKDVQERINMAIVDSINRTLQAAGFTEDDQNPDFRITYEAGGLAKTDVSAQRNLYASEMINYTWGNFAGISADAWAYSLAKMQITVTDAASKNNLWQAIASKEIRDPEKFKSKLRENVDKFVQKTMKSFPPKK